MNYPFVSRIYKQVPRSIDLMCPKQIRHVEDLASTTTYYRNYYSLMAMWFLSFCKMTKSPTLYWIISLNYSRFHTKILIMLFYTLHQATWRSSCKTKILEQENKRTILCKTKPARNMLTASKQTNKGKIFSSRKLHVQTVRK